MLTVCFALSVVIRMQMRLKGLYAPKYMPRLYLSLRKGAASPAACDAPRDREQCS